jgi:signal transduction histidine kinase
MAWVEYLKSTYPSDLNVEELDRDVQRLEKITSRFSSIGSVPHLKKENVVSATKESVSYLKKRLSSKIEFAISSFPNDQIFALLNQDLFSWVLENLCKNAVDAMDGKGSIDIKIMKVNRGMVSLDITDTGKGIAKNKINAVFKPGFTTKKRGWGLGLTLVKRIVENYHEGRIFIKHTENNRGTTFRLLLKSM